MIYGFLHKYGQGEVFKLMFRFDPSYPISAPAVQFVVNQESTAPVHPVCIFTVVACGDN